MNKTERVMISEVYALCNEVPNIRNNMSTGDLARYRFDSMEQCGYTKSLLYSLMMFSQGEEEFKERFHGDLQEFNKFVLHRKEEGWSHETTYQYRYGQGAW